MGIWDAALLTRQGVFVLVGIPSLNCRPKFPTAVYGQSQIPNHLIITASKYSSPNSAFIFWRMFSRTIVNWFRKGALVT